MSQPDLGRRQRLRFGDQGDGLADGSRGSAVLFLEERQLRRRAGRLGFDRALLNGRRFGLRRRLFEQRRGIGLCRRLGSGLCFGGRYNRRLGCGERRLVFGNCRYGCLIAGRRELAQLQLRRSQIGRRLLDASQCFGKTQRGWSGPGKR